jgi:hypothetical protein
LIIGSLTDLFQSFDPSAFSEPASPASTLRSLIQGRASQLTDLVSEAVALASSLTSPGARPGGGAPVRLEQLTCLVALVEASLRCSAVLGALREEQARGAFRLSLAIVCEPELRAPLPLADAAIGLAILSVRAAAIGDVLQLLRGVRERGVQGLQCAASDLLRCGAAFTPDPAARQPFAAAVAQLWQEIFLDRAILPRRYLLGNFKAFATETSLVHPVSETLSRCVLQGTGDLVCLTTCIFKK